MRTLFVALGVALAAAAVSARAQESTRDHHMHDAAPAAREYGVESGSTPTHDHMAASRFVWLKVDELEVIDADEALAWQGGISWGGHFDRLWLTSEGERGDGRSGELETQLFWRHAATRWWDTTLGLRQDSGGGGARSWASAGVKGLAPYGVEVAATAFVGEGGQTALRLEGEYELLITNRLILRPEFELDFYGKDDAARGEGRGLAESSAGLRLRYEVRREFAPYVGIERQRLHGDTAGQASAGGGKRGDTRLVLGLRLWL